MKPQITVGLVGPISAGMWIVTEALRKQGFSFYSLSDRVREKAAGLPPTRETWRQVGKQWRDEEGADIFARLTVPFIEEDQPQLAVVDSIRHPAEINVLREVLGANIFGLTAPVEIRYQLMLDRKRGVDHLDFERFRQSDEEERGVRGTESGQNIEAALSLADKVFEHKGDLDEIGKRVQTELIPWLEMSRMKRFAERV